MMSGKFCIPNMVDYYACYATRKAFPTNYQCEEPSPPPSEADRQQCLVDVHDYLRDYIAPKSEERVIKKGIAFYKSECLGGSQGGTGLQRYQ